MPRKLLARTYSLFAYLWQSRHSRSFSAWILWLKAIGCLTPPQTIRRTTINTITNTRVPPKRTKIWLREIFTFIILEIFVISHTLWLLYFVADKNSPTFSYLLFVVFVIKLASLTDESKTYITKIILFIEIIILISYILLINTKQVNL